LLVELLVAVRAVILEVTAVAAVQEAVLKLMLPFLPWALHILLL
jgi:hypothetical protein